MRIKKVVFTEKSKYLQEKNGVYTFLVSPNLNKYQIKEELISVFPDIKIKKVRSCCYKPVSQKARFTRKLPGVYHTKLKKKVFVELEKNSKDFFSKEGKK